MLKYFVLTTLLVVPSLCSPIDVQMGSAYGFTYGHYNSAGDYLYIDGPNGRDTFAFGFSVDVWGIPLINRHGQLVSFMEATADPALIYAAYGQSVSMDGFVGYLGWDSKFANYVRADPQTISDNGTVYGVVMRVFDEGVVTYENVSWRLPNSVAEPSSLIPLTAMLFVSLFRLRPAKWRLP